MWETWKNKLSPKIEDWKKNDLVKNVFYNMSNIMVFLFLHFVAETISVECNRYQLGLHCIETNPKSVSNNSAGTLGLLTTFYKTSKVPTNCTIPSVNI